MDFDYASLQRPRIKLFCLNGIIEGTLGWGTLFRTLDELNLASREFVLLHSPTVTGTAWPIEGSPLAINKSSILFALELSDNPYKSDGRAEVSLYRRVPVRIFMAEYTVQGLMYIPAGGDPMRKFNQGDASFIAVTSASIMGSQVQLSVPFVAVNLSHVVVAYAEPEEKEKTDPVAETEAFHEDSPEAILE